MPGVRVYSSVEAPRSVIACDLTHATCLPLARCDFTSYVAESKRQQSIAESEAEKNRNTKIQTLQPTTNRQPSSRADTVDTGPAHTQERAPRDREVQNSPIVLPAQTFSGRATSALSFFRPPDPNSEAD